MVWATVLLVGFVAFGIPAWIFALSVYRAGNKPRKEEPSVRYFAYTQLLTYLHDVVREGEPGFGPMWMATVRELRNYPEYADVTILYLEEINITGSRKFDRIMKRELKETEAFLLAQGNVGDTDASGGGKSRMAKARLEKPESPFRP